MRIEIWGLQLFHNFHGQVDIQVVNASLADPFYQRLSNKVDVILFNPPYVPTSEEEAIQAQDSQNIQGSWAGGFDGMQVTDAFLDRAEVYIPYSNWAATE